MMTKKDFQAFASVLYEAKMTPAERRKAANVIVIVCRKSNPAFDTDKFYRACGLNEPRSK